ncbi:MAG: exosortase H [Alcanivoracaceae bacterium]|nr:exosortase H [Alcanivoracaceae bacterium]
MARFSIIFIVLVISLFTLELFEPIRQAIILPFTGFLATFSAAIMQIFDADVVSHADIIRSKSTAAAVQIAAGCNGVEAVIILFAAIFAFPSSFMHKIIGFIFGFFAIQILNVIRIISLYYLLQWDKNWFEWFHLYLWQALIILDALIVWLIWLRYLPKKLSNADKAEATEIHS